MILTNLFINPLHKKVRRAHCFQACDWLVVTIQALPLVDVLVLISGTRKRQKGTNIKLSDKDLWYPQHQYNFDFDKIKSRTVLTLLHEEFL